MISANLGKWQEVVPEHEHQVDRAFTTRLLTSAPSLERAALGSRNFEFCAGFNSAQLGLRAPTFAFPCTNSPALKKCRGDTKLEGPGRVKNAKKVDHNKAVVRNTTFATRPDGVFCQSRTGGRYQPLHCI
jgi:hypothetical protein